MHALSLPRTTPGFLRGLLSAFLATLLVMLGVSIVEAATTTGVALKPAFDMLDELVGGYGKQLLVVIGFVAATFAVLAVNATGAILKFVGFVIFLAVGLGAAVTLSGACI